jgi:hypothetical protein
LELMTTLSKHVNPARVVGIANALTIVGSVLVLINFLYWSSVSHGFDVGYEVAQAQHETSLTDTSTGPIMGHQEKRTYEALAETYFFLGCLALGVLVVSGIKRLARVGVLPVLLSLTNVVLLLVVWTNLKWLLGLKDPTMNESLDSQYNALVRDSVLFDWMSIFVVSTLIALELCLLIVLLRCRTELENR